MSEGSGMGEVEVSEVPEGVGLIEEEVILELKDELEGWEEEEGMEFDPWCGPLGIVGAIEFFEVRGLEVNVFLDFRGEGIDEFSWVLDGQVLLVVAYAGGD